MKTNILFLFFVIGLISGYNQTPITLTFTGLDFISQNTIPIDSVFVQNLDEQCDTVLYGPEPVLFLSASWPVGINRTEANSVGSLILKQNYPNPFEGETRVTMYKQERGSLNLILYNDLGAEIAKYHGELGEGFHSFLISSAGNSVLTLFAADDNDHRSIKMVSYGHNKGGSKIRYIGHSEQFETSTKEVVDYPPFTFILGNQLMYIAYSSGYLDNTMADSPNENTDYTFNMVPVNTDLIPTVTTAFISLITQTTAISGGNVTSDGGATVTSRGVCWSTSPSPDLGDYHTVNGSGMGIFDSYLTGLTEYTLYYVRAYATNSVGTAYGNEVSFTTLQVGEHYIGENFQGGIIFYLDETGQHGLISSIYDQGLAEWGCYGTYVGGTDLGVGTGQANTTAIVNGCSQAGTAARICDDLVLNGYSDWFLPSLSELFLMYVYRDQIGNFNSPWPYWSSSEVDSTMAYIVTFWAGGQYYWEKPEADAVRAIRAF